MNLKWSPILAQAKRIVESYEDTGVTLRQLFYRLVAAGWLPNTVSAYKGRFCKPPLATVLESMIRYVYGR